MSLPRPGHDYCPSCYGGPGGHYEECSCIKWCKECDGMTNHTTKQHLEAERIMCKECNDVEVKDEDERCAECVQAAEEYRIVCACMVIDGEWQLCGDHLSEQAAYYEPDEGGSN